MRFVERAGRGVRLTAAGEAALPGIQSLGAETEALFAQLAGLAGRPHHHPAGRRQRLPGQGPARSRAARACSRSGRRSASRSSPPTRGGRAPGEPRRGRLRRGDRPGHAARARGRAAVRPAVRLGRARAARAPRPASPTGWRASRCLRLGAGSQGRRLLDDYLARERIQPASTIDVPSVSLLLAYVSGGLGVGLAPALALADVPRARVVAEIARVPGAGRSRSFTGPERAACPPRIASPRGSPPRAAAPEAVCVTYRSPAPHAAPSAAESAAAGRRWVGRRLRYSARSRSSSARFRPRPPP